MLLRQCRDRSREGMALNFPCCIPEICKQKVCDLLSK